MMTVLELSNVKARNFFLEPQCYGSTELPPYFDFKTALDASVKILKTSHLTNTILDAAKASDGVNYTLVNNKDGKYAWRPLQFIHPLLYADLVHNMTTKENWKTLQERFAVFGKLEHIKCASIPVVKEKKKNVKGDQILSWWNGFEQESIIQSLRYRRMLTTDITDCYGSIYTHAIAWSLHGKNVAKRNHSLSRLGNLIDDRMRAMRYGQTNGIPQGSSLMDFVAELVLGYIDLLLDEKLRGEGVGEYFILRYRDDYRIFVNDSSLGEKIIKELTTVLSDMGMRLNSGKTKVTDNIVSDSVKGDKLAWLGLQSGFDILSFEKRILLLFAHAQCYPNGGSLLQPLIQIYKYADEKWIGDVKQILANAAILVELAYRSPRCYQLSMAIMAKLIARVPERNRHEVAKRILEKFKHLPHTGYLQVWLQRIMKPSGIRLNYTERLCQVVDKSVGSIWDNEWLKEDGKLYSSMQSIDIVNRTKLTESTPIMSEEEINLFISNYEGNYRG